MRRCTLGVLLFCLSILGMPAFGANTVTVHIYSFGFSINPKGQPVVDPVIFPGDTIHWVWDSGGHNTASDPNQKESWVTPVKAAGSTFDKVFNNVGTFTYVCTPHKSSMKGKVIVLDPSLTIDTFTLAPTSVKGGNSSTGTVTLKANATGTGTVVKISSNNSNATVPASITIASGKKTGTFTVTTKKVTANVNVTITTQIGTATAVTATLTLTK